jgi:hypothetical protein
MTKILNSLNSLMLSICGVVLLKYSRSITPRLLIYDPGLDLTRLGIHCISVKKAMTTNYSCRKNDVEFCNLTWISKDETCRKFHKLAARTSKLMGTILHTDKV